MQAREPKKKRNRGGAMDLMLPLLALLLAGMVGSSVEIAHTLQNQWIQGLNAAIPEVNMEVHRALMTLEMDSARQEVRRELRRTHQEARKIHQQVRQTEREARREAVRAREQLKRSLRQIGKHLRQRFDSRGRSQWKGWPSTAC